MTDLLTAIALILLPAWLCCGIAVAWGARSASDRLGMILRASGLTWAMILTLSFVALVVPPWLCEGNALYGYGPCVRIPGRTANSLSGLGLVTFALGALYLAVLLVVAGIWEVAARRNRRRGP